MTDFRTEFFQFDGCDVVAGDMIRVKPSGPYQRDGFVGRVMHAEYDKEGVLHSITVYGGPGYYASTRTLYAHRFELLGAKEAAKAQKHAEQVAEKMKTTRRTKK
jgi:hypothetical protein